MVEKGQCKGHSYKGECATCTGHVPWTRHCASSFPTTLKGVDPPLQWVPEANLKVQRGRERSGNIVKIHTASLHGGSKTSCWMNHNVVEWILLVLESLNGWERNPEYSKIEILLWSYRIVNQCKRNSFIEGNNFQGCQMSFCYKIQVSWQGWFYKHTLVKEHISLCEDL